MSDQRGSVSWSGSSSNSGDQDGSIEPSQLTQASSGLQPAIRRPEKSRNSMVPNAQDHTMPDPLAANTESYMDGQGRLVVRKRDSRMARVYAPVEDPIAKRLNSQTPEASDPFSTPRGSPKDEHIAILMDDAPINRHTQMMNNNEIAYTQGHAEPLQPFDPNKRVRYPDVVRKVNPGFEILGPGTLDAPHKSNDITEWRKDSESDNNQKPKKSQWRSRGNSGPQFTEEV